MSLPVIALGVSIALAAASAGYAMYMAKKNKPDGLGPENLDDFQVTQAKEGSVVPLIYGRKRVAGNIIWYGNVVSEEIKASGSGGGKGMGGGGSSSGAAGYWYYVDVWQSIGLGKLNLIKTWSNNVEQPINSEAETWNNGTEANFPTEPGEFANKIPGVCHVFHKKMLCGENTTTVPTTHFLVERVLETGLPYENMANGSNPAAAVYDAMILGGYTPEQLDYVSFETASNFWYAAGYAVNLEFSDAKITADIVNEILSYVDGAIYETPDGKYGISAYDPDAEPADALVTDDFLEFSMKRPDYSQLPNRFDATYLDEAQDYSERTVPDENSAVIDMLEGKENTKSIDLKAFRDIETVKKRLSEIKKRETYPSAEFTFRTNLGFSLLNPGDLVTIENDDIGIVTALLRITQVDHQGIDKNEVAFTAVQVIEGLFDAVYPDADGTLNERYKMTPSIAPRARAQILMPYTRQFGTNPHTLFLIERAKDYESGFSVLGRNGVDAGVETASAGHWEAGFFRTFSEHITIGYEYQYWSDPSSYTLYPQVFDETYTIDDSARGIIIWTIDKTLDLSVYPALSREELFSVNRLLLVSAIGLYDPGYRVAHLKPELIAFQTIEAIEQPGAPANYHFYRIRHFLRGALNSQKITHENIYASLHGWLLRVGENHTETSRIGTWQKILMHTINARTGASDTFDSAPTLTTYGDFGGFDSKNVCNPGKIEATRSGGALTVKYYPASMSVDGAGNQTPENTVPADTSIYDGKINMAVTGNDDIELTSPNVSHDFTVSGVVGVDVSHIGSLGTGVYSTPVPLIVADADGVYTMWTTRINP